MAHLKEETHFAKQVYLYGDGSNQKPIKNVKLLSKYTNCPVDTIRDHIKDWRAISEQLALRHDNSPYSLSLSEDVLVQHSKEIEFLGKQVAKLRLQLRELDPMAANYHVVLGSYQSALTKWEKSSGILAHYNTAESAMKERAKAHERAKGKENAPVPTKRTVDTSRFDI